MLSVKVRRVFFARHRVDFRNWSTGLELSGFLRMNQGNGRARRIRRLHIRATLAQGSRVVGQNGP
jgi:hypothetical protein